MYNYPTYFTQTQCWLMMSLLSGAKSVHCMHCLLLPIATSQLVKHMEESTEMIKKARGFTFDCLMVLRCLQKLHLIFSQFVGVANSKACGLGIGTENSP